MPHYALFQPPGLLFAKPDTVFRIDMALKLALPTLVDQPETKTLLIGDWVTKPSDKPHSDILDATVLEEWKNGGVLENPEMLDELNDPKYIGAYYLPLSRGCFGVIEAHDDTDVLRKMAAASAIADKEFVMSPEQNDLMQEKNDLMGFVKELSTLLNTLQMRLTMIRHNQSQTAKFVYRDNIGISNADPRTLPETLDTRTQIE